MCSFVLANVLKLMFAINVSHFSVNKNNSSSTIQSMLVSESTQSLLCTGVHESHSDVADTHFLLGVGLFSLDIFISDIFLRTFSLPEIENLGHEGIVVRRAGAPYRRVRIPGSSDLCVCEVSANEVIALRNRCFHLMIQQAIHWLLHALF